MPGWTCDECGRTFGAAGRSHLCEPGVTLEEFLGDAVPYAGEVVEAVIGHLRGLGDDLIVDPLPHMVLLKRDAAFAMLRKRKRWVAVEFNRREALSSSRLSRKTTEHPGGHWHCVNVDDPGQVDDELLGWLTDAWHSKDPPGRADDPMIPDDVDDEFV